ncbi:hypothetical protein BC827DRAFT_900203 [Russula dissimulans]|nr:hypothetical protein BC827DRAFT_900203 [Russula dissimulans]
MACTTRSRAAGATRVLSTWISARAFGSGFGSEDRRVPVVSSTLSSSGSGGSTCSQLLSASASASASVSVEPSLSVTLTHATPASEGVSVLLLSLASLVSPVVLASSPLASEPSAAAGAAFSSLTRSTTESSVLAFSFSVSASASVAFFSSSSLSFSYTQRLAHVC